MEKLRELEARAEASERREAQYCRDAAAQKKKREKAEAALSKLNGSHGEAEAKAQKAARLADQFRKAADEAKRAAEERDAAAALEQRKKMRLAERLRLAVAAAELVSGGRSLKSSSNQGPRFGLPSTSPLVGIRLSSASSSAVFFLFLFDAGLFLSSCSSSSSSS